MSATMPPSVLLVEDDPDVSEAIADLLRDRGHEVVCARDGVEALAALAGRWRPQVILLDLMMPVMDGTEFREHQRHQPRLADIPVVIVSADRQVAARARALGVSGYLTKPVRGQQLLDAVRRYAAVAEPITSCPGSAR